MQDARQQQPMNSAQACERCHRRKTRCDKARPECGPCLRAGVTCLYAERVRDQMVKREQLEQLQRQVSHLESANRILKTKLATAQREADADRERERERAQRSGMLTPTATTLASSSSSGGGSGDGDKPDGGLRNEVANEVSFISTTAGGDRQFLGSASGLLFANLVRASIAMAKEGPEEGTAQAGGAETGAGTGKAEWGIDAHELPPPQLARSLVEAYLAHDHLCFPFLRPQAVRGLVDALYADRSHYASHPFESFVFNMLLAIATSQTHKFNWQALPDAETHHLRAVVHLDTVLCAGGLQALQAMLLLCQFRLSSSTKDSSGSLWHTVGIAARMCFELGLHRESTYKLKPDGGGGTRGAGSPSTLLLVRLFSRPRRVHHSRSAARHPSRRRRRRAARPGHPGCPRHSVGLEPRRRLRPRLHRVALPHRHLCPDRALPPHLRQAPHISAPRRPRRRPVREPAAPPPPRAGRRAGRLACRPRLSQPARHGSADAHRRSPLQLPLHGLVRAALPQRHAAALPPGLVLVPRPAAVCVLGRRRGGGQRGPPAAHVCLGQGLHHSVCLSLSLPQDQLLLDHAARHLHGRPLLRLRRQPPHSRNALAESRRRQRPGFWWCCYPGPEPDHHGDCQRLPRLLQRPRRRLRALQRPKELPRGL